MTILEKIEAFAKLVTEHQTQRMKAQGFTYPGWEDSAKAHTHIGKKFARVDVGTSGKFMVDLVTEEIFGIKAYGVVHKGHQYGTLNTINDWFWGEYHPMRLTRTEAA